MKKLSLFFIISLLISCNNIHTKKILISIDISKTANFKRFPSANELYTYVLDEIEYSENIEYFNTNVIVYFSYIGSDIRPKIRQVVLQPGKTSVAFDNISNRKKVVDAFKKELNQVIQSFLSIKREDTFTRISQSLSYQFEVIKNHSQTEAPTVIFITDGLEDNGDIVFKQMDEFKGISIKNSPDIKRLGNNYIEAFGDLTGYKIIIIECPSDQNTEISDLAIGFWTDIFKKSGAISYRRANL